MTYASFGGEGSHNCYYQYLCGGILIVMRIINDENGGPLNIHSPFRQYLLLHVAGSVVLSTIN